MRRAEEDEGFAILAKLLLGKGELAVWTSPLAFHPELHTMP
jgi:hypothetical protein